MIEFIDIPGILIRVITTTLWLALAALGLAVIFGMMGVINMAHGAMITVGAYVAFAITNMGFGLGIAFIVAPLVLAVIGLALERSIIHLLYDRPIDTILATWGMSLAIEEIIKLIFGTSSRTVGNPFPGSWDILGISAPRYRLFLSGVAVFVLILTYIIFQYTDFGVKSRAVIQDEQMASRLGVNVNKVYSITFMYGAALAGLAGAAMAPLISVDPRTGLLYLVQSFFVVIVGGTGQILAGTAGGSLIIGGSRTVFALGMTETLAYAMVFLIAIIVIRVRPNGLFGGN